ncbi:MAG: DUF503 domain-containing protein [Chloroflexi bacterium]|nr:DUF503 domain-containing protein [Chloroflexota bacterium]MYK33953.1 DUF503 domain-containing protein [Chloroflexota bacterium]
MYIGSCRLTFRLHGNDSLKGKRQVSRSLIDRFRQRYHLAAAEVAAMDEHQRLVIGIACVSNEYSHAEEMLNKAVAFADNHNSEAELVDVERAVTAED